MEIFKSMFTCKQDDQFLKDHFGSKIFSNKGFYISHLLQIYEFLNDICVEIMARGHYNGLWPSIASQIRGHIF